MLITFSHVLPWTLKKNAHLEHLISVLICVRAC